MLRKYLDERTRRYRSGQLTTAQPSIERENARYIWNFLRNLFIEKLDFDTDNSITIYLTVSNSGDFYYSDGCFFKKINDKTIWFVEKTKDIVLQFAADDGITVNCIPNRSIAILEGTNLFGYNSKIVYEFTYTPPSIEEE